MRVASYFRFLAGLTDVCLRVEVRRASADDAALRNVLFG